MKPNVFDRQLRFANNVSFSIATIANISALSVLINLFKGSALIPAVPFLLGETILIILKMMEGRFAFIRHVSMYLYMVVFTVMSPVMSYLVAQVHPDAGAIASIPSIIWTFVFFLVAVMYYKPPTVYSYAVMAIIAHLVGIRLHPNVFLSEAMNEQFWSAVSTAFLIMTVLAVAFCIRIRKMFLDLHKTNSRNSDLIDSLRNIISKITDSSKNVSDVIQQLHMSIEDLRSASEYITDSVVKLNGHSDSQVALAKESFQKVEQILLKINNIGASMNDIKEFTLAAVRNASFGNGIVEKSKEQMGIIAKEFNQLSSAIESLSEKSQQIGRASTAINSIAVQTHMLAINASIEASRAGIHGRGFSVVAEQVRNLSKQSSESVSEIKRLIAEVQNEIQNTTNITLSSRNSIEDGIEVISSAESMFVDISESINQVSRNISVVFQEAEDITSNSRDVIGHIKITHELAERNAEMVDDTAACIEDENASIEGIRSVSASLSKMSSELQAMINAGTKIAIAE